MVFGALAQVYCILALVTLNSCSAAKALKLFLETSYGNSYCQHLVILHCIEFRCDVLAGMLLWLPSHDMSVNVLLSFVDGL